MGDLMNRVRNTVRRPVGHAERALGAVFLCAGALVSGCAAIDEPSSPVSAPAAAGGSTPMIIAHRGASGVLPEHTLAAYARAIEDGADAIEPDLVVTRDGVLVARHDRHLSASTDIASHPEFAGRRRTDPAGGPRQDWWIEDFTLEEIRTLRAIQPRPGRSKAFDGAFPVPTFAEILKLAAAAQAAGSPVAIYPETKEPAYFRSIGLDFEDTLRANLADIDHGPIFVQSFEAGILRRLQDLDARRVFLIAAPLEDPEGALDEAAGFADGVGVEKAILLEDPATGARFMAAARARGLFVHVWTFRDDDHADAAAARAELEAAFALGADGVFTDFPANAAAARDAFLKREAATE